MEGEGQEGTENRVRLRGKQRGWGRRRERKGEEEKDVGSRRTSWGRPEGQSPGRWRRAPYIHLQNENRGAGKISCAFKSSLLGWPRTFLNPVLW